MNLVPVLALIVVVAFLTGSDSLFYLAYVLGGLILLSLLWIRRAPRNLVTQRRCPARAFFGEETPASLTVTNRGRLPVLWLQLHESLPLELHTPNFVQRVISLGPGESCTLDYTLRCRRRGYYHLGPLSLATGDFFDFVPAVQFESREDEMIVYPRVVPLNNLRIDSRLPYGSLASKQRIFQDPTRYSGVREYQPGDSLRQVNWKSSARAERLLVKRFQPAVTLNTLILLNLNTPEYSLHGWALAGEMGIVIAASAAAHLLEKRQRVGLGVLGRDAVSGQVGLQTIPPGRGRPHLMRLLETLARAELGATRSFAEMLSQATADLSWGSSVLVITAGDSPNLVPALLQLERRGFQLMVVATDPEGDYEHLKGGLEQLGIPAYRMIDEKGMDVWR